MCALEIALFFRIYVKEHASAINWEHDRTDKALNFRVHDRSAKFLLQIARICPAQVSKCNELILLSVLFREYAKVAILIKPLYKLVCLFAQICITRPSVSRNLDKPNVNRWGKIEIYRSSWEAISIKTRNGNDRLTSSDIYESYIIDPSFSHSADIKTIC